MAGEVSPSRFAADRGVGPVMTGEPPPGERPPRTEDDGLRRMLTWTFIALVVSLLMTLVGVTLAIRFFDRR